MKAFTAGLLLAGLMSSTALAQSTPQMPQVNMGSALLPNDHMMVAEPPAAPMPAPAAPVSQEPPKAAVVSGVLPAMPGTVPVATIDQYNSTLVTLGYEAQIDKLKAEIEQSKAELAKAKAAEKQADSGKPDPTTAPAAPPYMRGGFPGVTPFAVPENQAPQPGQDYPTVLSIFGSNSNLVATLKMGSGQIDTRVGDVLPGDLTVQRITGNGVLVAHDGKTEMLSFDSSGAHDQQIGQFGGRVGTGGGMSAMPMSPPPSMPTLPVTLPTLLPVPPMGGGHRTSAN
jgi:type IV pilus biogenesis protein PilP